MERLEPGLRRSRRDRVAVEEPLEIRVEHGPPGRRETHPVAVTMRTPGDDFQLAAGFLFSEGFLAHPTQLREITYCQAEGVQEYNVVSVRLREGVEFDPGLLDRNFYTHSSCGICGKASLESLEVRGCAPLPSEGAALDPAFLAALPELLREGQAAFQRTGGLHAAGLFDVEGGLLSLREDVGRHNALDKVIGERFLADGLPARGGVLVVSGRTSFEILQKTLSAGIPVVVAIGAPSSLAVDLARRFNITLVGFARGRGFNVYAGWDRVMPWRKDLP